jgi:hypothetical protein
MKMSEKIHERTFHQIAHELLKKEVEVITVQGNFNGSLIEVGRDIIIVESRGRIRHVHLIIRIDNIVAIFRSEQMPRGPFGFNPGDDDREHEEHESSSIERR